MLLNSMISLPFVCCYIPQHDVNELITVVNLNVYEVVNIHYLTYVPVRGGDSE